jgi:predicted dehydrogenase
MSDVKLRVALLGAGRIGQEHSRTLIADPRVQVVAVCDPRLAATSSQKLRRVVKLEEID